VKFCDASEILFIVYSSGCDLPLHIKSLSIRPPFTRILLTGECL